MAQTNKTVSITQAENFYANGVQVFATTPASADQGYSELYLGGTPLGYQHLAPTSATGLTVPAKTKYAAITISTATVFYRDDGTAPTTAAGHGVPLPAGAAITYAGDLATVQFISATGLVDVAYYG